MNKAYWLDSVLMYGLLIGAAIVATLAAWLLIRGGFR